jgi:hypothetical protein
LTCLSATSGTSTSSPAAAIQPPGTRQTDANPAPQLEKLIPKPLHSTQRCENFRAQWPMFKTVSARDPRPARDNFRHCSTDSKGAHHPTG